MIAPNPETAAAELQRSLLHFTGTDRYYRHILCRNVVFTDGMKMFADTAGAYWLIDIFATELTGYVRKHGMLFLACVVKDSAAILTACHGNAKRPLWSRSIDITDLPDGTWNFYMGTGGPEDTIVLFLPSEY
jgi:hypothetical protein